ncbi:protein kinase [Streptomyces sp. NBC_00523]|uniref:serine/threonine-protein kinase n=1 Tax=Streptomyces sp. NBC_00523 TaxID=2975765 RepID=UPI002E80FD2A|nr:protein kinase [Streptomyces sp. NBC_00523]WUD00219.1 protein kinase [Streptomyces sp. NBC_00523]
MRLRESAQATASRLHAEVLSGRYRLDETLGSGGAADVYRGFDLTMRRPVAVKVFRPDTSLDTEESWRGEAQILARLHHPGLVTAFDAGHHDGRAFLVMQLVEGTTLKNRIAERPLSLDATAELGADLAHALAHAHEEGIVHRDVKPSNILLDSAHRPYLADFGISRPLDATTRTSTDTLVGTASYLAPEQVLGRSVGRPADVYALGLVLIECLTGRLEYGGGPVEAAIARLHRPPAVPPDVPEQFRALLGRMTAQDAEARPTARDCAHALTAPAGTAHTLPLPSPGAVPGPAGAAEPGHAGPPRAGADHTRRTRGRTAMAGGGVALAAVAAVVLAVTGSSAPSDAGPDTTRASTAPTGGAHARNDGGEHGTTSTPPPAARSTRPHAAVGTRTAETPSPRTSSASSVTSTPAPGSDTSTPPATPTRSTTPAPSKTSPTAPATPGEGTPSAPATPSATETASPRQPPGHPEKTAPARDGEDDRDG